MSVKYDLLVKSGEVIDPAQKLRGRRDVAFANGKVAAVAPEIPAGEAKEVIDASGKLVMPGLVDVHTHFYYGVLGMCRDSRTDFAPTGVVTTADGGTAGAANYVGLRDLVIRPSQLHLYAFLNILAIGITGVPYVKMSMGLVDVARTVRVIQRNKDTILGVKAILSSGDPSSVELLPPLLKAAVQVAKETDCKVMVHIDGGLAVETVVEQLRPGDILTHAFHNSEPNIISNGKVRPAVREAVNKGLILDMAAGGHTHFAWKTAEAALQDGIFPNTISTDYVVPFRGEPMHTLPDCMSIMWSLGMSLEQVVAAVTTNAAAALGKADKHGSLGVGCPGDASILEVQAGEFSYLAMSGESRTVEKRLAPVATIINGKVWTSPKA